MVPPSLPLPPPLPMPSSSSASTPLAPFSLLARPLVAPPTCSDPPWVFWSLAGPWCVDPLVLPRASEPVTPPRPVDQSAPLWLLTPVTPPGTVVLPAPPGSLVPSALPWPVVALLCHRLPSLWLYLIAPSAPSGSSSVLTPTSCASVLWHPGSTLDTHHRFSLLVLQCHPIFSSTGFHLGLHHCWSGF